MTLLLAASLATAGCTEQEAEQKKAQVLRSVRFQTVTQAARANQQSFGGVTRAGSLSRLSFQVGGRLRNVYVKVGDLVQPGQRIARVDPTDIQLQLQQAKATAAQAKAQSVSAEAAYKRVRALYENNNAARQDLDTARAQKDSAASSVAATQQSVHQLERQIAYATLTAPAQGTITTVLAESNEVVSPGQVVATLQMGDQLEVAVDVPESFINSVQKGALAKVKLGAVSSTLMGKVHEIGIPPQGSTVFPITVLLPASDRLRPGLVAEVSFSLAKAKLPKNTFMVPASAVSEDRQGRFVYKLTPQGAGRAVAKRASVQIGELKGQEITIRKGLLAGDRIVTAGVNRIRDGLVVRVPNAKGASPKPSGKVATSKVRKLPQKPAAKRQPVKVAKPGGGK